MTSTLDIPVLGTTSLNTVAWAPVETIADGTGLAGAWNCDNCAADNRRARKRCADCGTSRD